jgi:hypothetical protein
MAERRPLSAAIQNIPDADPDLVRQFITQERPVEVSRVSQPPSEKVESKVASQSISIVPQAVQATSVRSTASTLATPKKKSKPNGLQKVGLIPVTVRLTPTIAGALKRASLERQLAGEDLFTQQDIVEQILEPWLREEGYLG